LYEGVTRNPSFLTGRQKGLSSKHRFLQFWRTSCHPPANVSDFYADVHKPVSTSFYLFKLAELTGDHNIVQIWSADQTILYATVFGSPEFMPGGPAEDQFVLEKNEKNGPKTLKTWFQARNPWGERFVYPKKEAKRH